MTSHSLFSTFAWIYFCAACGYVVLAIWCVAHRRWRTVVPAQTLPTITVLKPVYGLDEKLYDNLRSFCEQDYPVFQVVFALAEGNDPARPVIEQLIADLPERDLALVVNDRLIGSNRKICNVANAFELAKHEVIVIADSDMRVTPDYLRAVGAPFEKPEVGAATCLYHGTPTRDLPSAFGGLFMNEWFLPSVLVALQFGPLKFCFGATMAVRREILTRIGGFERLAVELADDYMLGKLVSDLQYEVALVPYVVENIVAEVSFKELFLHELRWARTVRAVQPLGYTMSFLTYVTPAALAVALTTASPTWAFAVLGTAVGLRIVMHDVARLILGSNGPAAYGLVVLRDLLCFVVWAACFCGRSVRWRGHDFTVSRDGHLELKETMSR
jgi:ceramide glucosyltransferase